MHMYASWFQNVSSVTRVRGPPRANAAPLDTIRPLKLIPGATQIKSQSSKEQSGAPEQELLGHLEQVGLLNKEPTGPPLIPWVTGPLVQARIPDQDPIESHRTRKGSRSKDKGSLELGALNQESMGLPRLP